MKKLLPILLLASCVAVEDERDCIEYKSTIEPREVCRPWYGNMICYTEDRTRLWCVLYNEETNE